MNLNSKKLFKKERYMLEYFKLILSLTIDKGFWSCFEYNFGMSSGFY